MAPKNKKKNAFYFYMREMKEREAIKGRILSMADLPNYAHPQWKQLSVVEKEPYEEMARKFNKDPSMRGGKLASDGTRVEDNIREDEEIIRLRNKMKQDIKCFCNVDCTNEEEFTELASKKPLYFISFNILCHTEDDNSYIPIEVGLLEYSIQTGIHREYTKILYPGRPPTGYAGAAKILSDDKHKIDIFGTEGSERDMRAVYNAIKKFTNPTGLDEYPPVFCKEDQLELTKGCLDWLAAVTRDETVFEVWNTTYLLMELRAGVGLPFPSETNASDLLCKTSFNYHPSTRCEFHEDLDNHYCALTYAKCLCYLISDAVCEYFNVAMTERHIPNRAIEEKAYSVTVFKEPSRSSFGHTVRLDKSQSYYQNENYNYEEDYPKLGARDPPRPLVPRQPESTCIAEEMNRLQLTMTTHTVPGLGLGRGIRRNQ